MPYKDAARQKEYRKQWRCANRDKVALYKKRWRDSYPEKALMGERRRYLNQRLRAIDHYSNHTRKCAMCGSDDIRTLTIDHINGGGNRHRALIGGTSRHFHLWLAKNDYPEGYQILCANCQRIKSWETGEYQKRYPLTVDDKYVPIRIGQE